jgi:hypothetical protein
MLEFIYHRGGPAIIVITINMHIKKAVPFGVRVMEPSFTMTAAVSESALPSVPITVSVAVYVPAVLYVC